MNRSSCTITKLNELLTLADFPSISTLLMSKSAVSNLREFKLFSNNVYKFQNDSHYFLHAVLLDEKMVDSRPRDNLCVEIKNPVESDMFRGDL